MSSKVGGIARAPVWGANLSYKSSPKSQPLLHNNNNNNNNKGFAPHTGARAIPPTLLDT